jgi:hypothetical protein
MFATAGLGRIGHAGEAAGRRWVGPTRPAARPHYAARMFQIGGSTPHPKEPAKPKRAPAAPKRVAVQVHLEPRQREKLALLGGEDWLREQIDQAKVPAVFGGE